MHGESRSRINSWRQTRKCACGAEISAPVGTRMRAGAAAAAKAMPRVPRIAFAHAEVVLHATGSGVAHRMQHTCTLGLLTNPDSINAVLLKFCAATRGMQTGLVCTLRCFSHEESGANLEDENNSRFS